MCLHRSLRIPLLTAKKDIVCYKMVHYQDKAVTTNKFRTCFYDTDITLGEVVTAVPEYSESELEFIADHRTRIEEGFIHSYAREKDVVWAKSCYSINVREHFAVVKCIIPKGTNYFEGTNYDATVGYASCKLKYLEVVG